MTNQDCIAFRGYLQTLKIDELLTSHYEFILFTKMLYNIVYTLFNTCKYNWKFKKNVYIFYTNESNHVFLGILFTFTAY